VVYRAHDEVLHRDVALKVVRNDARLDSTTSQSLLYRRGLSSSLSHPNICTIHEVGESDGDLYNRNGTRRRQVLARHEH